MIINLISRSYLVAQLCTAAQAYCNQGISATTRKVYAAGLRKYVSFCREINQQPLTTCENTLILFVTYLAQHKLSYAIIQVYLSAVRYSHFKSNGSPIPRTPKLNYILKGIHRMSSSAINPENGSQLLFQLWNAFTPPCKTH